MTSFLKRKGNLPMSPPVGVTDPAPGASEVYKYRYLHPELVEQLVSIFRIMFPHNGKAIDSALQGETR
jgi:hypothetical protein